MSNRERKEPLWLSCLLLVCTTLVLTLNLEVLVGSMFSGYFPVETSGRNTWFTTLMVISVLLLMSAILAAYFTRSYTRLLRQERDRFHALLDAVPEATLMIDKNGMIQIAGIQLQKLFMYSKDDLVGKSAEMLVAERSREQYHRYQKALSRSPDLLGTSFETIALKSNGDEFIAEINLAPIATKNDWFLAASVRNIASRKAAEEHLGKLNEALASELKEKNAQIRSMYERISDGFIALDTGWHFTYINRKALQLTDGEMDSLAGRSIWEVFPRLKGSLFEEACIQAMETQQDLSLELKGTDSNWFEDHFYPSPAGLSIYFVDISERKKSEAELAASYHELRKLSEHLQNVREEERKTIAREIHDELGQQVTALKMDTFWLKKHLPDAHEQVIGKLQEMLELINTTAQSVRKIATNLRPSILDDLGLVAALKWQTEEVEKRTDIRIKLEDRMGDTIVKPQIATGLFRIYQEALTNVVRHSGASKVAAQIYLKQGAIQLEVTDNGKGIQKKPNDAPKSFGLVGIKERVNLMHGNFELDSGPGKGTTIKVSVPL